MAFWRFLPGVKKFEQPGKRPCQNQCKNSSRFRMKLLGIVYAISNTERNML